MLLLASQPAAAQVALDWDVSGAATIAFTDNVAATPEPGDDATSETPRPEADGYGTLSPAVRLQLETPSITHTLGYAFGYNFYFIHHDANTFSNSLSYGMRAVVGNRSELTLSLSGTQSTAQQLTLLGPAGQTQAQPNTGLDGSNILVGAGLGQGVTTELSPTWTFQQAFQGSLAQTIIEEDFDQKTYIGSLGFNVAKAFVSDTLSIEQGNDVQYTPPVIVDDAIATERMAQLLHRARLVWTHDLSDEWATTLGAGIVFGYEATNPAPPVPQPSGNASIGWRGLSGSFAISAAHDAAPSILLRQVTLNDTLAINGQVPLPEGFDISGSTSGGITRTLLEEGGLGPPGVSLLADAALGWIPASAPVRIEVRYQFTRQFSLDPDEANPLFPTIQRHTGLLTTTFAFPGAPTAGGAAPFSALPPPTANPDILGQAAPRSERAVAEQEQTEREEQRSKKDGASAGE